MTGVNTDVPPAQGVVREGVVGLPEECAEGQGQGRPEGQVQWQDGVNLLVHREEFRRGQGVTSRSRGAAQSADPANSLLEPVIRGMRGETLVPVVGPKGITNS